jgi:type II secretory pathway pseudopilin PulG
MKIRKIKGYTLIEMLLVIGFVALASGGVYNIYNKAKIMSIVNQEVKVLSSFTKDIIEMYSSDASYLGLDNLTLNTARVTPVEMRDSTNPNNIINKFGGNITVGSENYGAMVNTGFKISYGALQPDYCTSMVMALAPIFDKIEVNGTSVKLFDNTATTPDVVATACSSNGNNPVVVDFHVVTTFKSAVAAPVPPMAPAPGTQFKMRATDAVCDISSPNFWDGNASIPFNVRNNLIFAYKSGENTVGACPSPTDYDFFMNDIATQKAAHPNLNWSDFYTNIYEPTLINAIYLSSKATATANANTICNNASTSVYGVPVGSSYVLYSGNKCKVN